MYTIPDNKRHKLMTEKVLEGIKKYNMRVWVLKKQASTL